MICVIFCALLWLRHRLAPCSALPPSLRARCPRQPARLSKKAPCSCSQSKSQLGREEACWLARVRGEARRLASPLAGRSQLAARASCKLASAKAAYSLARCTRQAAAGGCSVQQQPGGSRGSGERAGVSTPLQEVIWLVACAQNIA